MPQLKLCKIRRRICVQFSDLWLYELNLLCLIIISILHIKDLPKILPINLKFNMKHIEPGASKACYISTLIWQTNQCDSSAISWLIPMQCTTTIDISKTELITFELELKQLHVKVLMQILWRIQYITIRHKLKDWTVRCDTIRTKNTYNKIKKYAMLFERTLSFFFRCKEHMLPL